MNEMKELVKLETTASQISKILQKNYEVDEFTATELSLYFLSNNFQAMQKELEKKARSKQFWKNVWDKCRIFHRYHEWKGGKKGDYFPEFLVGVFLVIVLVTTGIIYLVNVNTKPLPYTGVVSEDHRFVGMVSSSLCIRDSKICLPYASLEAFDYQIINLKEGESTDMAGKNGHTITLTKKNKQVIFVEHE